MIAQLFEKVKMINGRDIEKLALQLANAGIFYPNQI